MFTEPGKMESAVPVKTPHPMSGVSETLLLPLYCRALESRASEPIIRDQKAVEITTELNKDFSKSDRRLLRDLAGGRLPSKLVVSMALRTRSFDRYVNDFLKRSPDGVVVSIGCGLDTRFQRIDNGKVDWYELDFPEVIELKRRFFQESDRYHFIPSSALDFAWMDGLAEKRGRNFLFYAEGVFMYLKEEQVRSLVLKLAATFPGAELVCEMAGRYTLRMMRTRIGRRKFQRRFHLKEGVTFSFGIEKGDELEGWGPSIKFIDEWTYFDEPEKRLGWFRLFGRFRSFRYAQWTVHYRFA